MLQSIPGTERNIEALTSTIMTSTEAHLISADTLLQSTHHYCIVTFGGGGSDDPSRQGMLICMRFVQFSCLACDRPSQ
jgi:hypothetical protein